MKNYFWVLLCALSSLLASAQKAEDVFTKNSYTFTWYGIDYSHVQLIGNPANIMTDYMASETEIKSKYFPAWNQLFIDEKDKYNIGEMLHRKGIVYNTEMTGTVNAQTPESQLKPVQSSVPFSASQIEGFVNGYPLHDTTGIGIVFIAESMDKHGSEAFYHVILFNKQTKELLLQKRMRGEPSGFGLRNYWAHSYIEVIEKVKDEQYNSWKKQYAPNVSGDGKSNTTKTPQKPLW